MRKMNPSDAVFITGTDTGAGKTVVAGLLGRYLQERGQQVITQKWIETGCVGFSEDIKIHLELMGKGPQDIDSLRRDVAPYNFPFPSSPHLAATLEKKKIDPGRIKDAFRSLLRDFDFVIVEGIGGALVPFSEKKLVIDIARELGLPTLIVAQNRLGAINHTLLTVEALRARHMKILGIIFNRRREGEDKLVLEDNLKIVRRLTGEKVLGELPWLEDRELLYKAFIHIGDAIGIQLKRGR